MVGKMTILDKLYQVFATGTEEVHAANLLFTQLVNSVNADALCANEVVQQKYAHLRYTIFIFLAGKVALKVKRSGLASVTVLELSASEPTTILQQITAYWIDLIIEMLSYVEEQRICNAVMFRTTPEGVRTGVRCICRCALPFLDFLGSLFLSQGKVPHLHTPQPHFALPEGHCGIRKTDGGGRNARKKIRLLFSLLAFREGS
jgi:hypothetical protein